MYKLLIIAAAVLLLGSGCAEKRSEEKTVKNNTKTVLIDIRSVEEFQTGHLKNAINIPHTEIAEQIVSAVPDKSAKLQLYCRSGRRVKIAIDELKKLNYNNLEDLGGMEEAAGKLNSPEKTAEK